MGSRLVLGIDNSIDFLNIAIAVEERLIEERHIRSKRAPSEILPLEVLQMLDDHGYKTGDLGLIVATLGPGSFTGIRVGLAFCKGLRAGGGIPLVGVPTLDVLASPFSFMETHYLCPMLDAKKGEVFLSLYKVSGGEIERLTPYQSVKPKEVAAIVKAPCICFGTGAHLFQPFVDGMDGLTIVKDGFSVLSGEALIREGLKRAEAAVPVDLKPIYGRRSEAEIKFNVELV
jgi:tRNA threonylcarbamoyladenosine biosynthesis protein TsaB